MLEVAIGMYFPGNAFIDFKTKCTTRPINLMIMPAQLIL